MKSSLDIIVGIVGIATMLDWDKIILACGSLGMGAIVSKLMDRRKDRISADRELVLAKSQAELTRQQARGEEVDLMVKATKALLENAEAAAQAITESEGRNAELRKRNDELRQRATKTLDELLVAREQLSLAKADLATTKRESAWQTERINKLEASIAEHERHVRHCETELVEIRKELEQAKTSLIELKSAGE